MVLVILDGFGERAEDADNAVRLADAPVLGGLRAKYPTALLHTSGSAVGLPDGQMGNSEVGHLNFGAGRIARTDLVRIDDAIRDRSFFENDVLRAPMRAAKARGGRIHVMGLVSDGGVHSSLDHLVALVDLAHRTAADVVVHAFLDGRDTPPSSARPFLERLAAALEPGDLVGTVSGRYWAMDRDKRWDRTERAWRGIALGEGPRFPDALAALDDAVRSGETDEFVGPRIVAGYDGILADRDAAIHANFRADRARQLTRALADERFDGFARSSFPRFAAYACMTRHDEAFPWPVAYPKVHLRDTLGEIVALQGWKQLRCAETEKYAHVTYFFSGGEEAPFAGEDRVLVQSPRDVATYDLAPEMSAAGVADAVATRVESGAYDFVLVNFANPDMVGHTGVLPAAVRAVESVDAALGKIVDVVRRSGGVVLVTADHGNCELMRDPATGGPHTAHTTNPVPLILVDDSRIGAPLREGRICDVAPTLLEIMGVAKPAAMTGESLLR